ncbi:SDR family NAD(P)-dependent oxidoreductase [Alkalihalobacterium bogoriense]|uniref:SDR family NAD(P)-dependent oxidoreductase n=1 Tax=Alkalihalobacterium bogoriense TaxID=246272 RepID=UPI000478BBA1|nr:SDR family oxidoreductase [Alkalihalobacterium bogoriense]
MFEKMVVMVTGGAQGIGKSIAEHYCQQGARVVITDMNKEKGESTATELLVNKGTCTFYPLDVREPSEIVTVMKTIEDDFGQLDILINNAAINKWKSPYELDIDEWDNVLKTNITGPFLCSREAAKLMKKRKKGSIVNIASTRALMSEPHSEAYAASKGGLLALTHALSASFQEDGIQVNAISPGWIETGAYEQVREVDHMQHFSNRVGLPKDIANACLFLTHPENRFVNGENIVIDGGMTRKMIYEE